MPPQFHERINPACYCLEGGLPPEKYLLCIDAGGWSVYYSKHGSKSNATWFETEDEVCNYPFNRLLRDPTTRAREPHLTGDDPPQP